VGLSKKQRQNAERLQAALDEHDKQQEDADRMRTAKAMGDAVRAGDEDELAKLAAKAKKKGWV
jgi:hypothetical protein